jgi:hypothetical protein
MVYVPSLEEAAMLFETAHPLKSFDPRAVALLIGTIAI